MFNLEALRTELSKYSEVIVLDIFEDSCCLEFKVKNKTGRQITYQRIIAELVLPWYDQVDFQFSGGLVKAAYKMKEI